MSAAPHRAFVSLDAEDFQTILRYSKGEQEHRFRGSCPDAAMGEEGYDPGCRVCQAIVRLEAHMDNGAGS